MTTPAPPGRARDAGLYAALLLLAGIASYLLWAILHVVSKFAAYSTYGRPQAHLTNFFFDHRVVLLLFPVPWLLFAIYSLIRGPRSAYTLVFFSSTLILALVTLSIIAAFAFTLPWIFIPGGIKSLPR